ncbi:hypothetical protein [Cohnella caldifontis]|uniref:hypothetical protein n=1 Tax=Cohnella caldifontis TaxID=3027471 RepID=UPI0023ED63B2|nr:hypothetical protein [Cohnella sp. YIM B05605]
MEPIFKAPNVAPVNVAPVNVAPNVAPNIGPMPVSPAAIMPETMPYLPANMPFHHEHVHVCPCCHQPLGAYGMAPYGGFHHWPWF